MKIVVIGTTGNIGRRIVEDYAVAVLDELERPIRKRWRIAPFSIYLASEVWLDGGRGVYVGETDELVLDRGRRCCRPAGHRQPPR